ncbi:MULTISPECIES: hypothetical protein [unclassified Anaeromyxobacter]|uniref:hypothetical protein n=1 Tax=unclassified Anaeromyxobacter TaxID=2620896 RepID=UPI001F593A4A|nr:MULTISPECIES: hypothetical protein [unclassified Anaeromyxobacter]
MSNRYQQLCQTLEDARSRFAAYHSECVLFAATLSRGLIEYAGWPRELVTYEPLPGDVPAAPTHRIEDAMHLDADAFWHVGLRLAIEEPRARDSILLRVRFKKLDTRYIVSLFGFEDFEVAAPTPEQLQPIYESILNAVKRHYEYGLRLFLENGGRGLKIPISTDRLLELARGAPPVSAPGEAREGAEAGEEEPAPAPEPAPHARAAPAPRAKATGPRAKAAVSGRSSPGSPGPRPRAPRGSRRAGGSSRA